MLMERNPSTEEEQKIAEILRDLEDLPDIMTIEQAATKLQVNPATIRARIAEKKLEAFRGSGTSYRIRKLALARFIMTNQVRDKRGRKKRDQEGDE